MSTERDKIIIWRALTGKLDELDKLVNLKAKTNKQNSDVKTQEKRKEREEPRLIYNSRMCGDPPG